MARLILYCAERFDLPADVCRGDRFFIHEDHAGMGMCFFCPRLKQGRNGSPVIGNEGQTLNEGLSLAHRILLAKETTMFPFGHAADQQRRIPTAQAQGNIR